MTSTAMSAGLHELRRIFICAGFVLLVSAASAAEKKAPEPKAAVRPLEIAPAKVPLKLPDGASREGWEAYVKNDFPAAQKAFESAVAKDEKDVFALEGLRATFVATGDYKNAQKINFQMILACPDDARCTLFASRAMEALAYVESRAEFVETINKAIPRAIPVVAANLKDYLVSLAIRADKPADARAAVAGLGYVEKWLFIAGPFGTKDKNNPMERRFQPERPLKTLEFSDDSGEKIRVEKDFAVECRDVNLDLIFKGARGIVYAFTNLDSDADQDVYLGFSVPQPYRVFLRGMPILQAPGEERFPRNGGELVKTHLVKGANPLLIKMPSAGSLAIRMLGGDYSPVRGVKVKPLSDAEMAVHEASSVRGMLFSERWHGSTSEYFLKRAGQKDLLKVATESELLLPEAAWFDLTAERESELLARQAISRRLAGSFPDSVGVLDVAASILQATGAAMNNNEAREVEEARQMRERALEKLPTSHQHLLGLFFFFNERELKDQALEKLKACVEAHPKSALALAELGQVYQTRQFTVEAEGCLEKAAALDDAYLGRLVFFHEANGNRIRARELRKKQIELGQMTLEMQYDVALRHGNLEQAESILERQEKLYPERASEWTARHAHLLVESGKLAEALAIQKKLYDGQARAHPQKRATLLGLLDLALRLDKTADAKTLLSEYLKDHPNDFALRQRLHDLEGDLSTRWWEPYDVKVSQIDTAHFDTKNYPTSNHAWVVDFMVTRILPDLSTESYVHIAQKVLNLQGINELSELLVRAQRQDLLYVRTVNPDGCIFQPENLHDFNLAQSASLYKVCPGSILEHAYAMHTDADEDNPVLNLGFNFNAIDAPRAVSRWVVMIADEAKPKLNIRKLQEAQIDEKILPGPQGFTVYQWTNKNVEGIKFEPLMPNERDQEIIPFVTIETPERPMRANEWLMRREREFIPAEAAELAQTLVHPPGAKAGSVNGFDAIMAWVRDNIQHGTDSKTMDDVWVSRTGNAFQMMMLAREMARSAGLNVSTAFLNGTYVPGRTWHSKNAKHNWEAAELAGFGSAGQLLVYDPVAGPSKWVHFFGKTPKYFGVSELNANQTGVLSLTAGEDGVRIRRVRGESLGLTAATQKTRVNMDENGQGLVSGLLMLYGPVAGSWREGLADPKQQNQIKEFAVRYSWPKIQIKKVDVAAESDPDWPLMFSYAGSVAGLAQPEDNAFFLPPFPGHIRLLDLRGPKERQHDLLVKEELSDLDQTITYTAPDGFAWTEVPEDLFIATEFGFFVADYNVRGRTLTCTRSYLMPVQRITPQDYPRLLDFLDKISAHQQQRIAYRKVNTETFGGTVREVFSPGYAGMGEDASKAKK